MKAYAWQLTGDGAGGMDLRELPIPTPQAGEVGVRIAAASLNYRDLLVRDRYAGTPIPPGSDGAGTVVSVGEGVTELQVGDRVVIGFFAGWRDGPIRTARLDTALGGDRPGVLTEYGLFEADCVARIPDSLGFDQAAAFPCAGVTAWNALMSEEPVDAGDWVLALGTGGVSMFAAQIAKLRGARVIATSSSDGKLERAAALGADAVINYGRTPNWDARVRELTDGHGVDFVVEVSGAATLERTLRACAQGAHVGLVGLLTGYPQKANAELISASHLCLRGLYVGPLTMLAEVMDAFAGAGVRPAIDRHFDFEHLPDAYEHLASGQHVGKVIVNIPGAEGQRNFP